MEDEIAYLRSELDQEKEARTEERRRHDTLMVTLLQRLPELEAPSEARDGTEMASPRSSDGGSVVSSERRSWLYRFFFGPG